MCQVGRKVVSGTSRNRHHGVTRTMATAAGHYGPASAPLAKASGATPAAADLPYPPVGRYRTDRREKLTEADQTWRWDGLDRPRKHDVNGWPRSLLTPHRRSRRGRFRTLGHVPARVRRRCGHGGQLRPHEHERVHLAGVDPLVPA